MYTMLIAMSLFGQIYNFNAGYSPPRYYWSNDLYGNPAIPAQLQNAMFRNQMSALNNQRLSLSIQGGQLWRERYRNYKDWQMERMQIDKYRPLEIAKFNRELKAAKAQMFPPRPSNGQFGINFNGKTYSDYEQLKQDPEYQQLVKENHNNLNREERENKEAVAIAIKNSAQKRHPDIYYKKIYDDQLKINQDIGRVLENNRKDQ